MKLHYERVWDADISENEIIDAINDYCQKKYPQYKASCWFINQRDRHYIMDKIISEYYCADEVPNAFLKPLNEYIKAYINKLREEDITNNPL